ncbi:pyrroloquinoline quinone biosynthesis protein PqqB [Spelaeicoccus albus]|uniref:Coenzyme PQQ synthesis protein B n=1 Tax=Spelaeicoccus albus TaxID=1280376 RepID=A0A7Z0AA12_9MICO|nr:pyrroloquinoline quinone biosynthesis protein PqqB [Spelaeicoccus albus]NYI65833.1 pyrroloquinoline quinone biosynthesis protein B [Spelaeicoccus albus]
MRLRVLGSAAGGGSPQWNCSCPVCTAVRGGAARPRTQSSVAVCVDDRRWTVINLSPDIHAQIESFDALLPRPGRTTPLKSVLLTDAELDHTLGLLLVREGKTLDLHATAAVRRTLLDGSGVLRTLERYSEIVWRQVEPGTAVRLDGGLTYRAFDVPTTKTARFGADHAASEARVVGYRLSESPSDGPSDGTGEPSIVYLPCAQYLGPDVLEFVEGCDCLLVDGTCWSDDELIRLGLAGKTSRSMGHVPISGPDGSLERLTGLSIGRTIYIHMNNTNPVLLDGSPERRAVEARGFEVAADGLEVSI